MTIATIEPVDPKEALDALFARGGTLDPSFHYLDVWQSEHADKFTVARSTGYDVLDDIYAGVAKLLNSGQTVEQATKDLTPILQEKGWWGKALTKDPKTGETVVSQLGSTRRLQTIFDTNLRVSYASGHWAQFEQVKSSRPFLRYVHMTGELYPRPTHLAHHNLCLPVDDPYWDVWAPPCGWGCHCTLQSLSATDVARMRELFFKPPVIPDRSWTNKRTGEVQTLPEGIDPGWGYNPGKSGSQSGAIYAQTVAASPLTSSP